MPVPGMPTVPRTPRAPTLTVAPRTPAERLTPLVPRLTRTPGNSFTLRLNLNPIPSGSPISEQSASQQGHPPSVVLQRRSTHPGHPSRTQVRGPGEIGPAHPYPSRCHERERHVRHLPQAEGGAAFRGDEPPRELRVAHSGLAQGRLEGPPGG